MRRLASAANRSRGTLNPVQLTKTQHSTTLPLLPFHYIQGNVAPVEHVQEDRLS